MIDYVQLEADLEILRSARTIIAAASGTARLLTLSSRNPDTSARVDIGIGVEYIDSALDSLADAIEVMEVHLPSFTPPCAEIDGDPEPHGSRDTFVPHPAQAQPEYCDACGNSLPLNAECRCSGCGNG